MHFNLLSMQRYEVPADFLASNDSQRVKYLHPVLILIKIGVLVREKNAPKMTIFYLLEKSGPPPPLVNDDDQAPSGAVLRKTNSIFIKRKDGILLRCMQIWNIFLLLEIFTWEDFDFQGKNCPPKCFFWPKLPPWCSMQVCVRNQTNTTVICFIPSTNYTPSMRKGFVRPFPILLKP